MTAGPVWLNGERLAAPAAEGLAWDRGLHYGDGVFRTLLVTDGRVHRAAAQLAKLRHDCDALSLPCPAAERLMPELGEAAERLQRGVLKLVVTAGSGPRGYARPANLQPQRWLLGGPLPDWPATHWREGVAVTSLPYRLGWQPALAGIKHLNRLDEVLARRQLPGGCVDGLLGDWRGRLVGGTMCNVFWIENERLCTPEISGCGVAGVTRARLCELAHEMQVSVATPALPLERVRERCDAVFLSNAVIGLWPVRRWDEREFAPHPLLEALQRALAHPYAGRV